MESKEVESKKVESGIIDDVESMYINWLYDKARIDRGKIKNLMEKLGSAEAVCAVKDGSTLAKMKIRKSLSDREIQQFDEAGKSISPRAAYEEIREEGIRMCCFGQKDYPRKLADIPGAPLILYYKGRLPDSDEISVAVIGSRSCSEYGRVIAEEFGRQFAEAGIQVISGMARGIDGISQKSAVKADGYSAAILGCGVDICYPSDNRQLYEKLEETGAIISEYPPGTQPLACYFPARNRIISGLSDAVVVVEAREQSGTMITVDAALEQGRDVYAVPGRVTDALSGGCNRLIRQGADLILSAQELIGELGGCRNTTASCQENEIHEVNGWDNVKNSRRETGTDIKISRAGGSGANDEKGAVSENGTEKGHARILKFDRSAGTMPPGLDEGERIIWSVLDYDPMPVEEIRQKVSSKMIVTIPQLLQLLLQMCFKNAAKRVSGSYYTRC